MMRDRTPLRSPFEWDPWHEIEDLRRTLDHIGRTIARSPAPVTGSGFIPEADVHDTGTAFLVSMDLPGVKEGDLDITAEGNTVTVRGQRDAHGARAEGCLYCERPAGRFARTIELPELVDADRIMAALALGVLEITLPKSPTAAVKKVIVALSDGGEGRAGAFLAPI